VIFSNKSGVLNWVGTSSYCPFLKSLGLGGSLGLGEHFAGLLLHLVKVLPDVVVEDVGGALSAGVEHVNEGEHLQHVVEGNEVEDKARKVVDDLENAEHNPVGEPLGFLLCVTGIECQEWLENGVCNSEQASNVGLANSKHDSQAQDSETVGRNLLGLQAGHAF